MRKATRVHRKHQGSGHAKVESSSALELRVAGSKVAGFQGYKAPGIQGCRISVFRGYRVPEQKPFAGAFAGTPRRKSCGNLSRRHSKTCGFSLSFVVFACIQFRLTYGAASCVIKSWNHGTLKNMER